MATSAAAEPSVKFDAGRDPVAGKRKIRYSSQRHQARRRARLARLVSEHDAGNSVDPSRTVAEFFDRHAIGPQSPSKTLERQADCPLQIKPNIGNLAIKNAPD
jgi:hypothetical protein